MTTTETNLQAELVGRATELVPLIRKQAAWQEEHRVMHDDVLQAVVDAGLMKMRIPLRYGGYEADVRTVCTVLSELSRGDGSVGWIAATMSIGAWLTGLFPDEVQDEVFADPDVRLGGSISPNGIAVPTDGGVILNGKWPFSTGVLQSQWFVHAALLADEDGSRTPVIILVPVSDMTIVDDWFTAGLRGTGSVTTVTNDLFVPAARVLPMTPVIRYGQHRSLLNADSRMWKCPFSPIASATTSAVPLGMVQAAREFFFERLPTRKITYTDYKRQIDAPLTHLQTAEAAVKIDEAEFHVRRAAERLDSKSLSGEPWTLLERGLARVEMGAACLRAKEAVDVLKTASGGSSIYSDVPIQRIERDIQTIALHGVLHPNTNFELYGRILCGLEPNTHLI
ncbi:acyl-CoA dehydrogenase [Micromonospora sp. KC207]|uniref:acyl-CoA dehydrogenase family protein n=1 Tax=Micromonospora sp. KC207 TaxID=2530377 RepID=UPI00104DAB42|nr:acyl-CoA dehydrogenase family protein [Micromonospora sp. KC207]TDC65495.1 acyl-CoA dehydrogenase [Micromonospora sp. KC207]